MTRSFIALRRAFSNHFLASIAAIFYHDAVHASAIQLPLREAGVLQK
jgi:hypothetical protein